MKKDMTNYYIEPPIGLLEKVLKRVHKEERLLVLRRIIIFSITLLASLSGLVPSYKILLSGFNQSGFMNFFSLMFSDFSFVMAHWQSFTMILLESLPAISLVVFLAVVLVFLQSIKVLTKNIKIISGINHLATAS